jgi:hypothetical protein
MAIQLEQVWLQVEKVVHLLKDRFLHLGERLCFLYSLEMRNRQEAKILFFSSLFIHQFIYKYLKNFPLYSFAKLNSHLT